MKTFIFDSSAISSYWSQHPQSFEFLTRMEKVEAWTLDIEDYEDLLNRWASKIDKETLNDALHQHGDSIITVLGLMPSSHAGYLLIHLNSIEPMTIQSLTTTALSMQSDPEIGRFAIVFLDRINAVETQNTLKTLFDLDRLALVQHAVRKVSEESAL